MAKQITCECGYVVRGETDDDVVQGAQADIRRDHPDLVESVTPEVLLGWIEEM